MTKQQQQQQQYDDDDDEVEHKRRMDANRDADVIRRNEHKQLQQSLLQQIYELEKEIEYDDTVTKSLLISINKQCDSIEYNICQLLEGDNNIQELERQYENRKSKAIQQVKKLDQAKILIVALKKDNIKLHTKHEKVLNKLLVEEENIVTVSKTNTQLVVKKEQYTTNVISNEDKFINVKVYHDNHYNENCKIKQQINTITDMYTDVATSRQEYQKALIKLLHLIEDQTIKGKRTTKTTTNNKSLLKEICTIAYSAEEAGKIEMNNLEIRTSNASLDAYSNHGF